MGFDLRSCFWCAHGPVVHCWIGNAITDGHGFTECFQFFCQGIMHGAMNVYPVYGAAGLATIAETLVGYDLGGEIYIRILT